MSRKGKAKQEALEALHAALAETLAEGIKGIKDTLEAGQEARGAAAILNVARQFLKDNGVESIPTASNPLGKLLDELPFDEESEAPLPQHRH